MTQAEFASWIMVAALGAFHGLNPAMGWLFAVALGMHRKSRTTVIVSLAPILIGHALAVGLVIYAGLGLHAFVDGRLVSRVGGLVLIAWAIWHALYGHRHRVRVGMRTGLLGLGAWSFLMASVHGAGLMLLPLAFSICSGGASRVGLPGDALTGLIIIAVHSGAMLLVVAAIAIVVYEWAGLAFIRRAWINVDLLWGVALAASGAYMLLA